MSEPCNEHYDCRECSAYLEDCLRRAREEGSKRMECGHLQADWVEAGGGHICPTGEHIYGRCCRCCDHDYEYEECVCTEAITPARCRICAELQAVIVMKDSLAAALNLSVEHVNSLRAEQQTVREEATEKLRLLGEQCESDRGTVAEHATAIRKAVESRIWLTEGRGSYEWDDDNWHKEFAAAAQEILDALEPLWKIAGNWKDCPQKWPDIVKARQTVQQRVEEATVAASGAMREACRVAVIAYNMLMLEDFEKAKCTSLELTVQQLPLVTSPEGEKWLRGALEAARLDGEESAILSGSRMMSRHMVATLQVVEQMGEGFRGPAITALEELWFRITKHHLDWDELKLQLGAAAQSAGTPE